MIVTDQDGSSWRLVYTGPLPSVVGTVPWAGRSWCRSCRGLLTADYEMAILVCRPCLKALNPGRLVDAQAMTLAAEQLAEIA